jgi:putative membrane protein
VLNASAPRTASYPYSGPNHTPGVRERWPAWVYGSGAEPDPRFSFANERTFLAWIRTALALLAGGVALDAVPLSITHTLQVALAAVFVTLGLLCAVAAWVRWARAERAIRRNEPLPASNVGVTLASVVAVSALALLAAWLSA